MRTSIGPYAVVEAAYEGVLSVVYRCRQGSREIAVKAVREDGADPVLARAGASRARLRALVVHPGVLPLLRLVDGEAARSWSRSGWPTH